MQRVLLLAGLVLLVVWILAIVSCALSPAAQALRLPKRAWLLVVVLLPVVGGVLWFVAGRTPASVASGPERSAPAPRTYSAMTPEERIRRLEEDLARLDAEEPPDGEPQPGRG